MNVVKATAQYALRTHWRLALVVFLMAVGLAVTAWLMEPNPFASYAPGAESIEATVEQSPSVEQPPSDEQAMSEEEAEEIGRTLTLVVARVMFRIVFDMGAILFGLQVVGGMVAGERKSGVVMLWGQHRGSLAAFYAKRYGALQVVNVSALLSFGLIVATGAFGPGRSFGFALAAFVHPAFLGALAASVSFGLSSLGIRQSAFAGLAYVILSILTSQLLVPGSPLATGVFEHAPVVVPYLAFPSNSVTRLVGEGRSDWNWGAFGLVLYHFALWSALAWVGLRRVVRRPLRL